MRYRINPDALIKTWALIVLSVLFQPADAQSGYYFKNVRLFTGVSVIESTGLLLQGETVTAIGSHLSVPDSIEIIDLSGKTIVPGLSNAHVHAWIPYHLENAFEAGVFTLFDMHSPSESGELLKSYKLEEGYAEFYSSGYAATVWEGHGTQYGYPVPVIGKDRSPTQFISESIERGSDYIKIIYEPLRKTLTREQVRELIKESKKNGLLVVAHASRLKSAKMLVEEGIDGLVHLWKDGPADDKFISDLASKNVFIIPTISVIEGVHQYYKREGIKSRISSMPVLLNDIRRLSEAGVMILAGTDPPNVGLDYGSSIYRELELFSEAGLSPMEALKAATSNTGQAFSRDHIGRIEAGKPANFLVIDGNPLEDISMIKNITSMWIKGKKINNDKSN